MNRKQKSLFYLEYTLFFVLIAASIAFFYLRQGKSMIDAGGDGFRQHFRALLYYADLLKGFFAGLLQGRFEVPQWDFVIGEGSDILQAFHYYAVGDVFTFFSFLCPDRYMHVYYDCATFARMYCSGLALGGLLLYKKYDERPIVVGGMLLYAFSSFALSTMGNHIFFISAAVYLPLLILGVEKIVEGDKPYLFSIAVALAALSNIYFFYINVVSVIVFVLVRLVFIDRSIKERFLILVKIGIFSVIGFMIGSIVFLPMLKNMLSSSRMDTGVDVGLFFTLKEYRNLFTKLVFGREYFGGFSFLWPFAVTALLCKRKNKTLIGLLVMAILFAVFPHFSKIFNAFTYPTWRWSYGASLLMSYIFVDSFSHSEDVRELALADLAVAIVYYGLCFYFDKGLRLIHVLLLLASLAAVAAIRYLKDRKLIARLCLLAVIGSIGLHVFYYIGPTYWNYAGHGTDIAKIEEMLEGEDAVFEEIKDDSFFRYSGYKLKDNATVQGRHSSTQYYWSIINDPIVSFRKQLAYSDNSLHHLRSYGERFTQNALSAVKYYVNSDSKYVPYGFEYLDNVKGYDVYESPYALDLLYGYDGYITLDEWNGYDEMQKNEALVQTAALDKLPENIGHSDVVFKHQDVSYQLSKSKGLDLSDTQIDAKDGEDAKIYLDCRSDAAGEYYVAVEGLYSEIESSYVDISYGDVTKRLIFKGSSNQHYTDRHDYLIDLGYFEKIDGRITLDLSSGGLYEYAKIRVICQPLAEQIKGLEELKIEITDLAIDTNKVKAAVSLDDDRLVCFAIPYSTGWRAYVDGKKVPVMQCNVQYLAMEVPSGSHELELRYSTPLLKEGSIMAAAGMLMLAVLAIREKKTGRG